ncbi:ABC transporter substrate-binding protein [Glutamicibacter arilaitensis]|uniref:ABC transporter substrate-binding protein n=1 Tax=Glutamicibacter arilaitensis TaxID=256701 RepID=UPI003FD1BD79
MLTKNKASLFVGTLLLSLAVSGCTTVSEAEAPQSGDASASAAAETTTLGVDEAARALLPEEILEAGVLTVASDPTYPPFEYYDTDNKTLIGWDIDMGDALGQVLGLEVKHVPATFATILPGLTSGKYHLGMSTFSVTEERRKAVDFVPYLQGGTGLAVAPGNPHQLAIEAATLCGKSIAVQKGSIQSLDVLPKFSTECTKGGDPAIDMQVFPTQNDANLALTSGRVQGVIADSVSLAYQGELAGGKFELAEGPDYEPELTGTALDKGSDLLPAIQAATSVILESEAYGQINDKWGLPESTEITISDVVLK